MSIEYDFIDLFAGIGGIRIPFQKLGGKCVFSSEIDEACRKMYKENFGEMPSGDIKAISVGDIPKHDILLAGFPCQPFSIIGNGKGFADTRGTLFFEIERILREKKPRAFLLENVKQLKNHDNGRTFKVIIQKLRELGYHTYWKVLDARDFGLPQKRERVFIVGFLQEVDFNFPLGSGKKLRLEDILEKYENVDKKHFASERIVKKRLQQVAGKRIIKPAIWHENKGGNIGINEFACALRAGGSYNYLLVDGIRRLTPREMLRLQGFPDEFKIVVPDTQARKQAGNAVPVNVIDAIAREMIQSLYKKGEDK